MSDVSEEDDSGNEAVDETGNEAGTKKGIKMMTRGMELRKN